MKDDKFTKDAEEVLAMIQEYNKNNNLIFIALLICKLQKDYEDIAKLSTDGNYQPGWTHKNVLDYLTYEQKF